MLHIDNTLVFGEVMVRLATANITTQVHNVPLTYRSFESETEAQAWLLQQPIAPQAQPSLSR